MDNDDNSRAAGNPCAMYEERRRSVCAALVTLEEAEIIGRDDDGPSDHFDTQGWNAVAGWVARDAVEVAGVPLRTVMLTAAGVGLQVTAELGGRDVQDCLPALSRKCREELEDHDALPHGEIASRVARRGAVMASSALPRSEDGPWSEWAAAALQGSRAYAERLATVLRGRREVIDGYEAEFAHLIDSPLPEEPPKRAAKPVPTLEELREQLAAHLKHCAPLTLEEYLAMEEFHFPVGPGEDLAPELEERALRSIDWVGGAPSFYAWASVAMWIRTAHRDVKRRPALVERLRQLDEEIAASTEVQS